MQGIFHTIRHLALIAIFLRAMVPGGWMPDAHGLTICSANDTLGVVHHDGGPVPPSPDVPSGHQECPFAAAPQLASTPDVLQLALPAFHEFAAATDRAYAATVTARFAPQSPRAPPLTV
jgi:hypothetical protein